MTGPLHITIIGVGSIGERHLRCFGETGRVRLSLCDVNEPLRDSVANRYQIDPVFADFDEVLATQPDAAVVCTPAHMHISMAMKLANAGIHLLIEKPLSTSLDDTARLRELVGQKEIITAIAYPSRLNPLLAKVRQELQSGRFGDPVHLISTCGQHFPFYRPAYREIYYKDRATGGGAIQDALTHQVNLAEWLVGPMTHVAADAAHQVLEGVDVEDTVNVIARHGQLQASYTMNQHQAPNETSVTVVCHKGTVKAEMNRNRWRWQTEPDDIWHDEQHDPIERDEVFVRQANMFIDALEKRTPVACTLEEGIQTLRANLAILKAADTRTWQDVGQQDD